MKQSGLVQIYLLYAIAGLLVIAGASSYGLFRSIKKQGELSAVIKQRDADLLVASKAYDDLSNERKKVEVITLDNMVVKEEIVKEVVKYRDRIKEIVKDAPPTDCINTDLPDNLRMLIESDSPESPGKDIPANDTHIRHELTVDAGQNLW